MSTNPSLAIESSPQFLLSYSTYRVSLKRSSCLRARQQYVSSCGDRAMWLRFRESSEAELLHHTECVFRDCPSGGEAKPTE